MKTLLSALLAALFLCGGCASTPKNPARLGICSVAPETRKEAVKSLDRFTDLIENRCYKEALDLGDRIRKTYRNKSYSVTSEIFSVFVPEDSLSSYVLESYERAYLSLLMATAYLSLGKPDDAAVELRQSYAEGKAYIYNYGEDPVNVLLMAGLWEQIGDVDSARPYWSKLVSVLPATDPVSVFANTRVSAIDAGSSHALPHLRIFALGRFPILEWHVHLARKESGYYSLRPKQDFPPSCAAKSSALLSTRPWLDKIAARYSAEYHPLLNVKSWIRFPIGIAYGLTTFSAGFGLAVGGCVVDFSGSGKGELCGASLQTGGYLMSKSGDVVSYTLEPDTRHWHEVPLAVLVTGDADNDPCLEALPRTAQSPIIELGRLH